MPKHIVSMFKQIITFHDTNHLGTPNQGLSQFLCHLRMVPTKDIFPRCVIVQEM